MNLQPGFIILDAILTVRILYLCQVVNADYDNHVQDEYLTQKYDLRTWSLLSTSHPRRYTVYAEELQKVIKTDDLYKIEPILKKIN